MIDLDLTANPLKRLAILNLMVMLTVGAANIGLIFLNIWIANEFGFNIPLFPLVMIGSALGCILFWVWCASRLRVERAMIRRCAAFAALPWWGFGIFTMVALLISLYSAEDTIKPAGLGLMTAINLVAGTVCFAIHHIATKPRISKSPPPNA